MGSQREFDAAISAAQFRFRSGRPVKLTQFFAIVAFLSIVITTSVSGVFLTRFLERNILQRDAVVLTQFVQSVAGPADVRARTAMLNHGSIPGGNGGLVRRAGLSRGVELSRLM